MPDLLLELFSEEIPARMQRKAADDLKKLITDGLVAAGLTYEGARGFATPRRLALSVAGIPARSPDTREERRGPRVGSPEGAIQGFLRGAGLASIDEATIVSDGKKGEVYVAVIQKAGRPAIDVIADLVPQVIRAFPWPKSQRWGSGSLRWVRPLHSIVCTFGPETEDPDIVPFEVDGIVAGNVTHGHRFLAPDAFTVRRLDDYQTKLQAAFVVLDTDRRKDIILHDAKDLAFASGLELIEDEGLLEEVAGLVEWPVVLMGEFDERFLAVPGEVIRATIRANQKCFVLRDAEGAVSNKFVLVSNIVPNDGGDAIRHGNGRVVRARLSDALYFYETDQKDLPGYGGRDLKPLDQRMEKIRDLKIVFHEKLGTQGERVERIKRLAVEIAKEIGADPVKAERAAELAKADLVTEVVGEFPEVQGLMGRRYAALQGEDASVCAAIEDHYKPQGPSDRVPTDKVAIAVALADKLDTLVGFWAIDEKPTGSKDPYALRRAALGVVRIVLENGLRVDLQAFVYWGLISLIYSRSPGHSSYGYRELGTHTNIQREPNFDAAWRRMPFYTFLNGDGFFDLRAGDAEAYQVGNPDIDGIPDLTDEETLIISKRREAFEELENRLAILDKISVYIIFERPDEPNLSGLATYVKSNEIHNFLRRNHIIADLVAFFHDRLKVQLRDSGIRHDLVDAVLSPAAAPLSVSPPQGGRGRPAEALSSSVPSPLAGAAGAGSLGKQADAALVPSPLVGEGQGEGSAAHSKAANSDLLLVVRRVEALTAFLSTEDGKNLLTGYNRAANILKAEEKKSGETYAGGIDFGRLDEPEEIALAKAIEATISSVKAALAVENFASAMTALASLRAPVDAFFDKILVNSPDPALRINRLKLLSRIRDACQQVADFSKIA